MEKLSAYDFALKSSSQMARPELTLANSFLAITIHRNRQISCMGAVPDRCVCLQMLLCVFQAVATVQSNAPMSDELPSRVEFTP